MDFIIDAIVEWLKGLLVDGIMGNLDGLFDNVNQSVGEIATQVGTTPADWNAGVFSMIRQISETAILPIAGVMPTEVAISPTWLLTDSNVPDRFPIIAETSISFSQSVICWSMLSKGDYLLVL